jgi:large subunit ribosomal protein L15
VKLHDLKPAPGSRKDRRRVGRGIAAGQGKTAGRGTKGQKARAGGSIPAWFEGGQTPLHQRIPKLRGFKNPFKVHYEIVNIGDIARLVELGELESGDMPGTKSKKGSPAPITVNQEILRAAGLVRRLDRPMKVLGGGELDAALFVVADAFTASARTKIEAAGGSVSVLEVPEERRPALRIESDAPPADDSDAPEASEAEAPEAEAPKARTSGSDVADADAPVASTAADDSDDAVATDSTPAEADAPGEEATQATKPARTRTTRTKAAPAADEDPGGESAAVATTEDAPDAPAAKPRAARKPRVAKPDAAGAGTDSKPGTDE